MTLTAKNCLAVDLTAEDLEIFQRLPLYLQASSIVADRYEAEGFVLIERGWRVLGYRSALHMLALRIEARTHIYRHPAEGVQSRHRQ